MNEHEQTEEVEVFDGWEPNQVENFLINVIGDYNKSRESAHGVEPVVDVTCTYYDVYTSPEVKTPGVEVSIKATEFEIASVVSALSAITIIHSLEVRTHSDHMTLEAIAATPDLDPKMPMCQCCKRHIALGVASTILAPMSVAYCYQCLRYQAEPWDIFEAVADISNRKEHVIDIDKMVNPQVLWINTYKNGRYIPAREAFIEHIQEVGKTVPSESRIQLLS